ncbi:MAG: alpha/beta fold hydrolase [Candidatus Eremiobacterota bacterium]
MKNPLFISTVALGIMASINSYIFAGTGTGRHALEGKDRIYLWRYGNIFYKVRGEGKKILLLHNIHQGASSFEWNNNFSILAEKFRVYAPDLPGFGQSDKLKRGYRAKLYVKSIFDFIDSVIEDECSIIASGLSSIYAIRNGALYPKKIKSLFLIDPPLLEKGKKSEIIELMTYQFVSSPVIGRTIYNLMTSKLFIRNFLKTEVYSKSVTGDMVNYYHMAGHQKGSELFYPSFICGLLNMNVSEEFKHLNQEITVLFGKETDYYGRMKTLKNLNPAVKVKIFEHCKILPHGENAEEFNKFIEEKIL